MGRKQHSKFIDVWKCVSDRATRNFNANSVKTNTLSTLTRMVAITLAPYEECPITDPFQGRLANFAAFARFDTFVGMLV